ncbi:hypothetical protein J6590_014554 [Homalodisca vitripennis]|nr:hypothetical protein J6590_014554 [Homalodisca vitripennis]
MGDDKNDKTVVPVLMQEQVACRQAEDKMGQIRSDADDNVVGEGREREGWRRGDKLSERKRERGE